MSVINQMLRDLEARRGGPPSGPYLGSVISSGPTRSRRPLFLGLALLVAGLLGAVALLLWERHATEAPAVSAALPATPSFTAPAVSPAPAPVLAPVLAPPVVAENATPAPPVQPATAPALAVAPRQKSLPPVSATKAAPPDAVPVPPPSPAPASPPGLRKTPRALSAGQQAERAYADAVDRLAAGDHEAAESLLREALRHDTGHRPARETLGGLYLTQGRLVEGTGLLDGGLRQAPGHLPYRRLDARLKLTQGDTDGAIQTLETGLAEATDTDAETLAFLAALLQQTDRYEESAAAYRNALSLTPQVSLWWMGLGISLEAARDESGAFAAFRQALALGLTGRPLGYVRERLEALGKQAVSP